MTLDLAPDDQEPPEPGDLLVTARFVNRVTAIREVESRTWCNRWRVTYERVGERVRPDVPAPEGKRTHYSGRYPKGIGPAQWFDVYMRTGATA